MNDNNRDNSWFQLGIKFLLVASLLGMFYGVTLAHTLVASAETPIGVEHLDIAFEHCADFGEYELMVEDREIPSGEYRVTCSDRGANITLRQPLAHEPTSFSLNGFNR